MDFVCNCATHLEETSVTAVGPINGGSNKVTIGMFDTSTSNPYDGLIDEIRISNVARSDDWIATQYNTQDDPSTFFTATAEALPIAETDSLGVTDSAVI